MQPRSILGTLTLALAVLAGSAAAQQDEQVFNISGATLFSGWFGTLSQFNDVVDIDGDGNVTYVDGNFVPHADPLVYAFPQPGDSRLPAVTEVGGVLQDPFRAQDPNPTGNYENGSIWWIAQYRGHGSGNGLKDLVNTWGGGIADGYNGWNGTDSSNFAGYSEMPDDADGSGFALTPGDPDGEESMINGQVMGNELSGDESNAGGDADRTYQSPDTDDRADNVVIYGSNQTQATDPMRWNSNFDGPGRGSRTDAAVMDVPTTWFVTVDGTGQWSRAPRCTAGPNPGYGTNALASTVQVAPDLDNGGDAPLAGIDDETYVGSGLKSLSPARDDALRPTLNTSGYDANGTAAPEHQVFDTKVAYVPIGFVANPGVAVDGDGDGSNGADGNIKKSELQHLYASGRMPTGENLIAISRDSGSGTRNGAMNSIGVDPAWGRGEHFGPKEKAGDSDILGPFFSPSNINSSSHMRDRITECRLAIGYNGFAAKAGPPSMDGRQELLNVMNDTGNGSAYVRPIMNDPGDVLNGNIKHDRGADKYYRDSNNNGILDGGETWVWDYEVNNVINNGLDDQGWQVGGVETIATVGCPWAEDVDYDGLDLDGDGNTYGQGDLDEIGLGWRDDDGDGAFNAADDSVVTNPAELARPAACGYPYHDANSNGRYDAGETLYQDVNESGSYDAGEEVVDGIKMQNAGMRDYLRNLGASIELYTQFVVNQGEAIEQFGTPAQALSESFALVRAVEKTHDDTAPGSFTANPEGVVAALQDAGVITAVDLDPEFGGEPGDETLIGGFASGRNDGYAFGRVPQRYDREDAAAAGADWAYTDTVAPEPGAWDEQQDGEWEEAYFAFNETRMAYAQLMYEEYGAGGPAAEAAYIRNAVAGDFDGNGYRSGDVDADSDGVADDIQGMVAAWYVRHAGGSTADIPTATTFALTGSAVPAAGNLCPELMGDFNCDGRYDAADVRYGADGLYLRAGSDAGLDRKANFIDVDEADADLGGDGNFFDTVLATAAHGATYTAGDSRGDVAGNDLSSADGGLDDEVDGWDNPRGWAPIGPDGVIDATDIDYVYAQFMNNPYLETVTGSASIDAVGNGDLVLDWDILDEAVYGDLSCDMDGDLDVDNQDVIELVEGILQTHLGDLNLDTVVDGLDLTALAGNWDGVDVGYAGGDVNGDGVVDGLDLTALAANWDDGLIPEGLLASIPEPATLGLLGLGGLALLRRRRS